MDNNQLKKEIVRKAKKKLRIMSNNEIQEKAMLEKIQIKKEHLLYAIVFIVWGVSALVTLLIISSDKSIDSNVLAIFISFAILKILVSIGFFIDLKRIFSKTNEELALRQLIKEFRQNGIIFSQDNDIEYQVSQTIDLNIADGLEARLLIDGNHRVFQIQKDDDISDVYQFSDVRNYEVYENGAIKVSGAVGQALIGGVFFGLGGMIVGSSVGRTIKETCSRLKLIIRLNDVNNPQIEIVYINFGRYSKNSSIYQDKLSNLQLVCSQLEYMINAKTLEESSRIEQSSTTVMNEGIKQQILMLQEMYKDGLISEEEFQQKKKQILGL